MLYMVGPYERFWKLRLFGLVYEYGKCGYDRI